MERKVVITGIGVLSPIGIGRDNYWEGLFQGKTGFREITLFDATPFQVHLAGEIPDFDPLSLLGKKGLGSTDMPPIGTSLIAGDLAFRQHQGGHTDGPNWPAFLQFASRYMDSH